LCNVWLCGLNMITDPFFAIWNIRSELFEILARYAGVPENH